MEQPPKYFFISQESPTNGNENETKEAAISLWRLPRYCQFLNKISRDISNYIWEISRLFQQFVFVYATVSRETLKDVLRNPS